MRLAGMHGWILFTVFVATLQIWNSHASPICTSFLVPPTALTDVKFGSVVEIGWTAPVAANCSLQFNYTVEDQDTILDRGIFSLLNPDGTLANRFTWAPPDSNDTSARYRNLSVSGAGHHDLRFTLFIQDTCRTAAEPPISTVTATVFAVPAFLSLIPILIVMLVAVLSRHVILALFLGIVCGASLLKKYNPFSGLLFSLNVVLPEALGSVDHATVILFTMMFGGLIAVICKSGGAKGMCEVVVAKVKDSRQGMLATWLLALCVFFDDYANVLIAGNTLRSITDYLRISRERLACLVDATAAPIVSIAPISTWVGFEVALIQQQYDVLGIEASAYSSFLQMIPLSFYAFHMLALNLASVLFAREQFSMKEVETKARAADILDENDDQSGMESIEEFSVKEGVECRWYNAAIPIGSVVLTVFLGLIFDGYFEITGNHPDLSPTLSNCFQFADAFSAMMWAGFAGFAVPLFLYWGQKIIYPREFFSAYVGGIKEITEPLLVLILAWGIGIVCQRLFLAEWMASAVQGSIDIKILPLLVFLLSSIISLSVGSSWSAMTILFPMVVPFAYELSGRDLDTTIKSMASILSGAVFGDHVSPISDTTVLTSLACRCEIGAHVKTQLPYAMIAASVSIVCGTLPVGMNLYPSWAGLLCGIVAVFVIVRLSFVKIPIFRPDDEGQPSILLRLSMAKDSSKYGIHGSPATPLESGAKSTPCVNASSQAV